MFKSIRNWASVIALLASAELLHAQDQRLWLDDQAVIVARLSIDQPAQTSSLIELLAESAKPASNELRIWQEQLTAISQTVKAAGGKEIVFEYSLADPYTDQPLLAFPGVKSLNIEPLKSSFIANGMLNPFRASPGYATTEIGGDVVAGTKAVLSRVKSRKAGSSKPAAAQLTRPLGDNLLTVTATLNSDQRRALGEMVGTLPKYLGNGQLNDLLAELTSLQVDIAKDQSLVVTLTGKTDAIEARLKAMQANLASDRENSTGMRGALGSYLVDQIVSKPPKRNGDSLTWTVSLADALKSELGQRLGKVMVESDRMTAVYRVKTLGLALHNHHSAYQKFPSVNNYQGKPRKLSWRVDLLPFIDQTDLWKEFHFDEPWDSEHNKKLIPRMPEVFRCPQSKHPVSSGLSTFVLPVHEKAMWSKTWETEFPGIQDGTSNTIMTVEVRDELAQVWTKPDAFEIDLAAPEKQLGGHFEGEIVFGSGDGSASVLDKPHFNLLPALITRAGGEVIDF